MYVGGFYAYSILALLVWETRRSDFGVSMAHHVATVILIVLSYILRYWNRIQFAACFHFWVALKVD